MAVTADIEKQLAWEARQRPRAGIAAAVGSAGLIVSGLNSYYVFLKLAKAREKEPLRPPR